MKIIYIFLLLLPASLLAQSSLFNWNGKPMVIGLDVAQSIPSYFKFKDIPIRNAVIIEPVIGFNTRERKWTKLTLAYAHGMNISKRDTIIHQIKFTGIYAKLGFETQRVLGGKFSAGYGPIISVYSLKGKYRFYGPVFGDYYGDFKDKLNVCLGGYGNIMLDFPLKKQISMRISGQLTTGFRLAGEVNTSYVPGFGYGGTYGPIAIGVNGGIQLFYHFRNSNSLQ